jgi:glycosyltransferase involved in cell wall biosynthesis
MAERLDLPVDRVRVVHDGVEPELYSEPRSNDGPMTIGYLSRLCQDKGFDLLAEAFIELKRRPGLAGLHLRVAGGETGADEPFIRAVQNRLAAAGVLADVDFLGNLTGPEKIGFLRSLTVLSVPERRGSAAGFYALEALACGVPVVQSASGVFPEYIEATGGGLLFQPGDATALTDALAAVLGDPAHWSVVGENARSAVLARFTVEDTVKKLIEAYTAMAEAKGQTKMP